MSIGEWLVVALACGAGIVGLPLAGAVIYAFLFIKRPFDRVDQTEH